MYILPHDDGQNRLLEEELLGGKPEIRGKDRFSTSVAHPMDALKRSLRLCGEVEGEKEMVEANIFVTEHAAVARFVEDEIIDGARIAKPEQIKSR